VSSQEALGIAGECAYRVPSLSLPGTNQSLSLESLSQYDAVRLFIERAMAVKTDFAVTEQNAAALASVCQSLDGIPLAIELAAARVRSMTVDEVRRRLDDRFLLLTGGSRTALARQRTLLAAIQWSYDLLEEKQRAVLCRLSVFAGGWTLDASEQVCRGDNIEEWEVLDLLTALVDKSLVVAEEQEPGQTRYRILETVRQYARDRLMESGESEGIRERHQAFFAALAEATEPKLHGPEQAATLNCLESEHDNLRAALNCQGTSARLRLAASLWWFWYLRGYLSEGRSILAEVLKESIDFGHTPARAKALHGAGILAEGQFDLEPAQLYYAESLAIYRELGDNRGAADSLNIQGFVAGAQGNHRKARELFEQSLLLGRELGDKWLIGNSLNGLGSVTAAQGEYAKAQTLYEESTTLFRNLGAKWGVAWSLQSSGNMALSLGDFALAKTYLEQSLAIMRELGNERGVADTLYGLGVVARYNGDYLAASVHYEHSLVLRRKLEDTQGIAASLLGLGHTTQISGDYAAAAKMYRESLSILRTSVDALGIANSFEAFAALASEQENTLRGVLLWGAAEAIREEIRSPMPASIRPRYVRQVSEARGCLTEHAFAAAWTEGREMSMEQAIEFALEVSKV
jgi:predicted ATPase